MANNGVKVEKIIKPRVAFMDEDPRHGCHVRLLKTLYESISTQVSECKCVQLYLGNKTTYVCRNLTDADRKATLEYCEKHNKTFYVHCPLIANLSKDTEYDKSMDVLGKELTQICGLPGSCVLHIGKLGTIENVSQRVNELCNNGSLKRTRFERVPYPLLLESAAGQGTELGCNWEEMRHLFEGLDKTCIGLCIDTQHAFASGMCDFKNHESVVKLFDECDALSYDGVSMFHMNDSKKEYGSRVDRHEVLGKGYIWYKNDFSLRSLLSIARDREVDCISETDDGVGDIATMGKCC